MLKLKFMMLIGDGGGKGKFRNGRELHFEDARAMMIMMMMMMSMF